MGMFVSLTIDNAINIAIAVVIVRSCVIPTLTVWIDNRSGIEKLSKTIYTAHSYNLSQRLCSCRYLKPISDNLKKI